MIPQAVFSSSDLYGLMDGYAIPNAPSFGTLKDAMSATPKDIELAREKYNYRSVLFNRIRDTFGEKALDDAMLILGWPDRDWHKLDRWGTRINNYAAAEDGPGWCVALRGRV